MTQRSTRMIRTLLLALVFLSAVSLGPDFSAQAAAKRGWVTVNGQRYYYNKKGKKATGLKNINGSQY